MHQRGIEWMGVLCAVVIVLVLGPAIGWAASEGEGHGGGLISLDKSLIVQGINFLILLVLLQRLLYRPFMAKMEERTLAIQRSLEEAQAARAEAARQQEENEARLRTAHAEAAAIRERAIKDAQDEARRQIDAARAQSKKLDAEIRRARDELRREVADLATGVAEKLVRRSLRDEDHRRIVDDAIARIRA